MRFAPALVAWALLGLVLVMLASPAGAFDAEREQRLGEQIVDAILDGDPLMLDAQGHQFLSIYTESDRSMNRAVVVLHGRGFHPDWVDVVNPLRVGLAERGWNTLSIQLPVLEKQASYHDYVPIFDEAIPRIDAAIDFLEQQGQRQIVIIAHSCGAHMAMHYLRRRGDDRFDALVGIGMGATDFGQPMREPMPLDQLTKPLLDIYGGNDFPAVQRLGALRAQAFDDERHPRSAQVIVPRADHYFVDQGDALVEAISAWLQKLD